jgi:uncharacterized protein YecT (DUF1311 family)
MIRSFCFSAAFLCMAGAGFAQDIADVDCIETMVQQEMNLCAEQDWMDADADLNIAYAEAIEVMKDYDAALPKPERGAEANLRSAQRAWVTFRDAACAAEGYAMHGGSAEPLLIYGCRAYLTRQRADDLARIAAY